MERDTCGQRCGERKVDTKSGSINVAVKPGGAVWRKVLEKWKRRLICYLINCLDYIEESKIQYCH